MCLGLSHSMAVPGKPYFLHRGSGFQASDLANKVEAVSSPILTLPWKSFLPHWLATSDS